MRPWWPWQWFEQKCQLLHTSQLHPHESPSLFQFNECRSPAVLYWRRSCAHQSRPIAMIHVEYRVHSWIECNISCSTVNAITCRSSFWTECEPYLLVFFLDRSARAGSSLANYFKSCMKFDSVSSSPFSTNPCLAKNLRWQESSNYTVGFLSFDVSAGMKAFPQCLGKNKVEQLTPWPLLCDSPMMHAF